MGNFHSINPSFPSPCYRGPEGRYLYLMRTLTLLGMLLAPTLHSATFTAAEAALWREDLKYLAERFVATHRDPFHKLSRERFQRMVADLDAKLPSLDRDHAVVGFARILAAAGDGHTHLIEMGGPGPRLPVEFYWFADGLFVSRAADPELAGAKVVRLGNATPDKLAGLVEGIISSENVMRVRAAGPFYLRSVSILRGLDVIGESADVPAVFEKAGRRFEATLRPNAGAAAHDMRTGPVPLYQKANGTHWFEFVPESKLLYVKLDAIQNPTGDTFGGFVAKAIAEARRRQAEKLVLDLRDNGGGNNGLNRPAIRELIRAAEYDQPGKLFVIVGRETFSAAMNLANLLELYTNAVFVGEPTGSSPNHHGDAVRMKLPRSGIAFRVSTLWWQDQDPRDRRPWIGPHIAAEQTSAEYARGEDPALAAILRYRPAPDLRAGLQELGGKGDWQGARRAVLAYARNPVNKYRPLESLLNNAGYGFLGRGDTASALEIFRINSEVYPESANVWDSLAEGYERAGKRELAIESYQKVLQIDPAHRGAKAALDRLRASLP